MAASAPAGRRGEYQSRGDYHRHLDESWDYLPTYLAKMSLVRRHLDRLPEGTRVLDAGCGEGILVEEYHSRLRIEGVDPNYRSEHVQAGSVVDLPFGEHSFEHVLCLDVLEHLLLGQQERALAELFRVLAPGGDALISVPNLAHLQSRLHFLLRGRLIRTASPDKHPGDRPVGEYVALATRVGFRVVERRGIFPTVPVLSALIRRNPRRLGGLHRALTRVLPVPGVCFLVVLHLRKPRAPDGRLRP
ncbi:MAG: class I SAM-dependent methyltransferase [Acidobacteriota bacterium]